MSLMCCEIIAGCRLWRRAALTYGYSACHVGNDFHGGEGWCLGQIRGLQDFWGLLIACCQAQEVCHSQQIAIHSRLIFLTLTCHRDRAVFSPSFSFHMAVDLIPASVKWLWKVFPAEGRNSQEEHVQPCGCSAVLGDTW